MLGMIMNGVMPAVLSTSFSICISKRTNSMKNIKAVGLLSGGLDSTLAAKLMLEQDIEVFAINFVSPFCLCTSKGAGCPSVNTAVSQLGDIPLKKVVLSDEYLNIIQNPVYGYGKGLNPCLDCRILKIRKAFEHMKEVGADFIFTGEVLGQRPMSQHRRAFELIDKTVPNQGLLLRPLSAHLLQPTIPEIKGWVDRKKLLKLEGRTRKPQINMAENFSIQDYPCPAGGCLLTVESFAERLKLWLSVKPNLEMRDVQLLKNGRLVITPKKKLMLVARNEEECNNLSLLRRKQEWVVSPMNFLGTSVWMQQPEYHFAVKKIMEYSKSFDMQKAQLILKGNETITDYVSSYV